MALPEAGYTQPVEIVVGGALPRNGYVQPVEIVAGSGMSIGGLVTGGTPGSVLFVDAAGNLGQNNASFFWDNTTPSLKLTNSPVPTLRLINSDGDQVKLTQRVAGDGLINALTTGGDVRVLDPANGRQFDLTFYSFGCSLDFNGSTAAGSTTGQSLFEFHGYQNSALGNHYHTIFSIFCGGDTQHEVHVRPMQDDDGIILNYPLSHIPVIYTEGTASGSPTLDFGVKRQAMLRIERIDASNWYFEHSGDSANDTLEYRFYDNGFNGTGTLKARMLYAGANGAGSRYFGLINSAADYMVLASDLTIFYNSAFGAEYGRWTSTALQCGTTNGFDLGASGTTWKNVYFGTQAIGPVGSATNPTYSFTGATNYGFYFITSTNVALSLAGAAKILWNTAQGTFRASNMPISWDNADSFGSVSLQISRDAANVLALKNSDNAQTFRTYAGNGANLGIVTVNESLTIAAAASTDSTTTIPAGAVILAVAVRVTTVIPTAATFTVTAATGGATFDTAAVSTAANSTDAGTAAGALYTAAGTKVRITPNLNPATATGVVRLAIMYYLATPPTS
jgi:hypothetical protein